MHLRSTAALLLASVLTATAFAASTVSEKITQTYPFNADGVVSLAGVNGSVEIIGWEKNEVSLEAEKIASDAEGLARMQIVIEHSPAHLTVKTEHERKWKLFGNNRAEVRYKLHVPATAALKKIDVVNATITVRGVTGYADLDTVNGAIDAEGLASGGRFDTVNGSIRVSFRAVAAKDKIVLDTVNGSCELTLPADAAFELKADTVNGHISCDFPLTLTKKGRSDLAGTSNGGGATVGLDSVNGALSVRAAK